MSSSATSAARSHVLRSSGRGRRRSATQVLTGVPLETLASLGEHGNVRAEFAGRAAIVARVTDTGEPGYDLFVEAAQGESLKAALRATGASELDAPLVETLRIEAGMPKFHRDMDEDTIPLEAGIESRAISLTKGCYVGQEVIIRVLHRGHGRVARKLVGLTLEGDVIPQPAAAVHSGDREVGRVTSSARSPALQRPVALAYVHRDFVAEGTQCDCRWRLRDGDGSSVRAAADLKTADTTVTSRAGSAWPFRSVRIRINSASAAGNSSAFNSSRGVQRISCPSCGAGSPSSAQRTKCSSTRRSG